jgi:hypothetical protein
MAEKKRSTLSLGEPKRSKRTSELAAPTNLKTEERTIVSDKSDEQSYINFDPIVAKTNLRRSFLITLTLGSLLILIPMKFLPYEGNLKILFSAILMLIYYLGGMKYVRSPNTRAVFADSLYYLGFLFTFIALVGAMTSLNDLNIQSIIVQMGPALVTTVIGMAARIYLTQFEPITSEPETEAISSMSNLSSQIIASLKGLEEVQKTSAVQIKTFSDNLGKINFSSLNSEFTNLAESIKILSQSTKELKDAGERTKLSVDQAQTKFDGLDTSVSNAKKKLDDIDILTDDISTLNSKIETTAATFKQVGEKLETKVSLSATEAVNSITAAALEAGKAKDEAAKLTGALNKTVTEVAEFLNRQK